MLNKADKELLQAISDMMDIKLDERLSGMATRDYFAEKLHELKNDVLEEIDIVQEKSNQNYDKLKEQMNSVISTINMIKVESSTINILVKSVSDLRCEVSTLKSRMDRVS